MKITKLAFLINDLSFFCSHRLPIAEAANSKEYQVLRLSYGLDCDKHSANEIASKLNINVNTAHVRISQIKRDAIQCLIDNVDSSQVLDYL